VAAIADYERARTGLYQDVVRWQQRGWIDEVYPMVYDPDFPSFRKRLATILAQTPRGSPVYPGIGVFRQRTVEETTSQIALTRSLRTGGYALYAFTDFFPSPSHEYEADERARRLRDARREAVYVLNAPPKPQQTPPTISDARSRRFANIPRR
jgi:uncharacterized lipoprotein YddW (UPF0748 family)